MSYEAKKDEMIGKHVAEFQTELTLAKKLEGFDKRPPMPYGYPVQLYHPHAILRSPRKSKYVKREHGKLSNDVPWVLSLDLVNNIPVGLYNPKKKDK